MGTNRRSTSNYGWATLHYDRRCFNRSNGEAGARAAGAILSLYTCFDGLESVRPTHELATGEAAS